MATRRNVLSFGERVVPAWPPPRRRLLRSRALAKRDDVFLDFLIDGRPLQEVLEVSPDVARSTDEVSDLGNASPEDARLQVERLLGLQPNQYGSEAVWLLFCPVCHEEGCGGVSAKVERVDDVVVWSMFAWESILGAPRMPLADTRAQRFVFDAAAYDAELLALRERFAGL